MKKNCWEVKLCGRCEEIAGDHACPVCRENRLNGTHDGLNAGRACWTVPHTRCGNTTQGTFGSKFDNCVACDFYNMVKAEERGSFQLSATILARLNR